MRPVRGLEAEAQLLGQARGDARALPREGLAVSRATAWPTIRASRRCSPRSPSSPGRPRSERRSTAAASSPSRCRCERWRSPSPAVDERVADAMRAYPELIRGPRAATRNLMQAFPAGPPKAGPKGCSARPRPTASALALKVEDGPQRALRPALGAFLDNSASTARPSAPVPVRQQSKRGRRAKSSRVA